MTAKELIEKLSSFPQDLQISFLCPDGFEDSIDAVELETFQGKSTIQLSGYADWARKQKSGSKDRHSSNYTQ